MIWSLPQDEESGNLKEAVRSIETKLDGVAHSPSAGSEEQSTQDATPAHGKRRNAYSNEFKIAPVDHAAVTEAHDADEPAPDDTGDATSKPSADVQPSAGLEDDTLEDYSAQTPVSVAKTHPKEASHHDQELYNRGETQFVAESKSTASKSRESTTATFKTDSKPQRLRMRLVSMPCSKIRSQSIQIVMLLAIRAVSRQTPTQAWLPKMGSLIAVSLRV